MFGGVDRRSLASQPARRKGAGTGAIVRSPSLCGGLRRGHSGRDRQERTAQNGGGMDTATQKSKLLRGSRLGLVRVTLAFPLYLVLTPLALHLLGTPLFAVWSFQTMVVALFTISNLGFTNGLVFYLARRLDERVEVNRYFNVAFFTFLLLGGALCSLIVVGSGVFS